MTIKKLLAIICVAALLVTMLAGCIGKTDKPAGSVPSPGQTQPPTTPTDPGKNPTDPTNPNDASEPTDPTEATDPGTDPTEPSEPVNPVKPAGVIEDFENGLPAGADFYAPNTFPRIEELENGNHVLAGQYSVDGTAWHGVKDANYQLGQSVNRLQITVSQTAATHVALKAANFWFDTDAGSLYPTGVKLAGNVYTLTFDRSFTVIKTFAIEIRNEMLVVYVDDLKIAPKDSGGEDPVDPPVDPVDPPVDPVDPPVDPVDPPVNPVKPAGVIEDFENGLPAGADFYAPNTVPRIEELENGNHVLAGQYSVDGTAWHGVKDANYKLGQSVNRLQITVSQTAATHVALKAANFWFDTDVGGLYPVELKIEGDVYTLIFDKSFSVIKTFAIEIRKEMLVVYVDDLKIAPKETGGEDPTDPPVDPPVDPVDPPVDPVDPPVDPVKPEGVIEDFENGLPAGADFYAPDTFPRIEELENGNHVLAGQYSVDGTAWHGVSNGNYDLGKSVNRIQLTFIQNGENPVTMAAGAFWFDTDAGSLYPVELKIEGNVYTLTFDKSFSVIKTFAIEIRKEMLVVYVDDLMIAPEETGGEDPTDPPVDPPVDPVDPPVDPVDPPVDPVDPPVDPVDPPVDPVDPPVEPEKPEGIIENFENGLPDDADFYAPNTFPQILELEDGNHVLAGQYSAGGTAWHGVSNGNYDLGKSVNRIQLTFIQNGENPVTMTAGAFWFDTDAGSLYPVELKIEGDVYTLIFDKSFSVIKTFAIEIRKEMLVVYVDDLMIAPEETGGEDPTDPPVDPPVDPVDPPVDPVDPPVDPIDPPVEPEEPEGIIEDFENGLPTGADFYAPNTFPQILELEDGNHVLAGQYSAGGTAWHGVSNGNYDLGKSVNQLQLTFIQNGENPVTMAAGAFWFDTDVGGLYPVELKVDGNVYILTFDKSFSVIKTFAIEINSDMGVVYVDDLMICEQEQPEDPYLIVDFTDGDLSNVQSSQFTSYEIIERDGEMWLSAYSTAGDWIYLNNLNYTSDTPMTAIDIVVRCEADLTKDGVYLYTDAGEFYASGMTNDGNVYHFTFAVEFTTITRFSMLVPAETTVQIREIKVHIDTPEEEQNPNLIKDYSDGDLSDVVIATGTLSIQQIDGENWLTVSCGAADWLYLKNLNYSNGSAIQAIQIELKSDAVLTANSIYLYTDAGAFYASSVTNEGNVYTFTFDTAFTTLNEISMLVDANTTLQIKQILAVE